MVILGKTTKLDGGKQGYKFNSYVKSDRAAVATHIKVKDSEEFLLIASGTVRQVSYHGRCDVGSVWATGEVRNESCD